MSHLLRCCRGGDPLEDSWPKSEPYHLPRVPASVYTDAKDTAYSERLFTPFLERNRQVFLENRVT